MKASTSIIVLLMLGCLAWADDAARKPAPAQTAKPAAAKAAPPATATPTAKPSPAAAVKPGASKPATPVAAATPKLAAARPAKAKTSATKRAKPAAAKPAKAPEFASRKRPLGKRDPFVSPIVTRVSGQTGCATGKRCLVIDQIVFRGTVSSPGGIIAVVENSAKKAYFLRENDPVFNGYVVKITGDSVVFKETVVDRIGRTNQREVVKRVNAPAV